MEACLDGLWTKVVQSLEVLNRCKLHVKTDGLHAQSLTMMFKYVIGMVHVWLLGVLWIQGQPLNRENCSPKFEVKVLVFYFAHAQKLFRFCFLEHLGPFQSDLTKGKGHNSRINTSISPPFIPSSVLRSMILWPQSGSAAKIGAGVVQSFQCPWIPTFWSWLHWHFCVRKRSQPKKHIWYLSVSSEIYSTQAFFCDDSIGLSHSCTGRANDMNLAESRRTMQGIATKKKSALHDLFSLKP